MSENILIGSRELIVYISPMAENDRDHNEESHLTEMDLRVRALETILVDKGYIETAALDRIVELDESRSARISARR